MRCLRRAIVHFAVDTEQVFMTIGWPGDSTRFLPFNRGDGDGAGNPARAGLPHRLPVGGGAVRATAGSTCSGASCHLEKHTEIGRRQEKGGKLFPRFHQWERVPRWSPPPRGKGRGTLLGPALGGVGKSNTIAWLAHRLVVAARDRRPPGVRQGVVITDRSCSTAQLQETIYQFERTHGVVAQDLDEGSRRNSPRRSLGAQPHRHHHHPEVPAS